MPEAASEYVEHAEEYRSARKRRRLLMRFWLLAGDVFSIALAVVLATGWRFGDVLTYVSFEGADSEILFLSVGALLIPIWIALLWSEGLYDLEKTSLATGELGRVARALSLGVVALILLTYVLKLAGLSRAWTLLLWLLAVLIVLAVRAIERGVVEYARRKGRYLRPTLVVGSNAEAADIVRILRASRAEGLVPIGCLASSQAERLALDWCAEDVPCLGDARQLRDTVLAYGIDTVVIASSAFDHDVLGRMLAELRSTDVDVNVSSGLFEVLTSRVIVREIGGVPLITIKGISLSRGRVLTKRVFDLSLALGIVIVGMPVWLVVIAAIKLTSPGPVFYRQERVGRAGARFGMLKFRSMVVDAEARLAELTAQNQASGPLFKMKDDPRVTSVGRWMRKFSIDEFPQLINVITGEMSLVGPRPPLPSEVVRYTEHDWRRLEVVPGMTGLWQVSGRSSLTFDEMVRLDLFYIENWSVSLDVSLLVRTLPAVLFARGAY